MDIDPITTLRVSGIKSSCERGRLAFLFILLASCTVIVSLFNTHFAWSNHLLWDHMGLTEWPPDTKLKLPSVPEPRDELVFALRQERYKQIIRNGQDNQNLTIGLLGFRVDSSDLTLFGSLAMWVVSMYNCLCTRRINYDIGSLAKEISSAGEDVRKYVLTGIRQSLVLNIADEERLLFSAAHNAESRRVLALIRKVFLMGTYLPSLTIALIVVADLKYALTQPSAKIPDVRWWWSHLEPFYKIEFVSLDALAIILFIMVVLINRLTGRFQQGITEGARALL